ncbi:MAG TPA: PAS domain-containing protein [Rhizomicrobium sp.]
MLFTKTTAQHILSERKLCPRTERIALYWLSLWDGDILPARAAIHPGDIKDLLPGLIFFEVVPRRTVTVRMAGTDFCTLLKRELTGADWLQATPQPDRATRLAVFSQVARGAIGFGRWNFSRPWHGMIACEKLLLPLRPEPQLRGVPVLGFVDWSPVRHGRDRDPVLDAIAPPQILDPAFFPEGGKIC